ncbi:MAG: oligosaccharide flippase family protein [Bacilli bacterium]|nr:oligosaccharide flippase family protein [Bacilli bacterium]
MDEKEELVTATEPTPQEEDGGSVTSKRNIKNILIVLIGNIFTIVSSILVGFFVPKMMNVDAFGYYKTFALYFEYTTFLSVGFSDGIYLLYAGTSFEKLDKPRFRLFSKLLLASQAILSILVCVVSVFFIKTDYGFIFFFVGLSIFLSNLLNYYQYLSRVTERYGELTVRDMLKSILNIASVVVLFVLYKMGKMSTLNFKLYIVIYVSILAFIVIIYSINYRHIIFGKSTKLKDDLSIIGTIFKMGIPLMIANFINSFILIIDKQFVNVLFDKYTYGIYAFAYSMLGFITTAISAISTVLFPVLKRLNENALKEKYVNLISAITMVVAICLSGYFPILWICQRYLNNYIASMEFFRIILPGLMICSPITMIMYNYYKSMGAIVEYFIKSIIVLAVAFLFDLGAYLIFKNTDYAPKAISIASILTFVVWYVVVEFKFYRMWKLNYVKNMLYLALIAGAFYGITYIPNIYVSFGVWMGALIVITVLFQFKIIKNKFRI